MAKAKTRISGAWQWAGSYRAYHPNPLPPTLAWTPKLMRSVTEATGLLGRLAGEGRRLPNPHILLRPFLQREAVFSSRIEGTQSTLGELLAAEAGAAVARSPDDLREVGNYVAAIDHGRKRLESYPLSLKLVRELHAKLMTGVRGGAADPGEFRRVQNWIGAPGCTLADATYVPPPPGDLDRHLAAWEKALHDAELPPIVQAALLHYQFEAIHPFLDGNGRVGRLLITLFLCDRGVLPLPLLYLSAFFDATRRDYYGRLRDVTERGAWEAWVEYFCNGVARQSEDALSRAERINAKVEKWRAEAAAESSPVPARVVDLVAANPFVTPRGVEAALGVAYNTAAEAIRRLEARGILEQQGEAKRDRVYCAWELLAILEEPARLAPESPAPAKGTKGRSPA
jgi:Fic family protein